jgi:hypothetical protein|tara:strand:+ start:7245 stop:8027 length:783 start_codon:yes stop_codon:yes gene_type:complete
MYYERHIDRIHNPKRKAKRKTRSKAKPRVQLTAAQKKVWAAYKRDAKEMGLDAGPKRKRRKGGTMVNESDPLPDPPQDAPWIQYSDHPKEGADLRCMACGAWYAKHRSGEFHTAHYEDGVARVRHIAEAAGDENGGYKSRGPVLWAMRVLKTADFIAVHYITHGGTGDNFHELQPWENIGVPGSLRESNAPGNEFPHDPLWQKHPELGLLVYSVEDEVWYDSDDTGYECAHEDYDTEAKCSAADVVRKAVDAGELEDIPF